jgi:hypothetical protein
MSDCGKEGWDGERRIADGARVYRRTTGEWAIVTADERTMIVECPCCDRAFLSAHAARSVADEVLPVIGLQ